MRHYFGPNETLETDRLQSSLIPYHHLSHSAKKYTFNLVEIFTQEPLKYDNIEDIVINNINADFNIKFNNILLQNNSLSAISWDQIFFVHECKKTESYTSVAQYKQYCENVVSDEDLKQFIYQPLFSDNIPITMNCIYWYNIYIKKPNEFEKYIKYPVYKHDYKIGIKHDDNLQPQLYYIHCCVENQALNNSCVWTVSKYRI